MKRIGLLFMFSLLILSGCAVNMSLVPEEKPLEEKLLEGTGRPKILLLDLDGIISFKEETDYVRFQKKPSKVAFFVEALRKAEADPDIAGVIVRINSPGGSVAASDTVYHEIMRFRHKKKVKLTAFIMGIGTSGGYYVASAADRIVASPTSVTGSIGVLAMKFNLKELLLKLGISEETYKSGKMKDFWLPFRPSTPEEKEMLQNVIDRLFARFIEVVYANRKHLLTETKVKELADGRILTAREAAAAKLIDQVAYLDETIDVMKKSLNIEEARVISYAQPRTLKSNIYSETAMRVPQVINLISINAEDLSLFSGVQFMYLWNP